MWFTRQNSSLRGWFQAIKSTGQLRRGLTANDFTVTVINSSDTLSFVPSVSESIQRPGNYYFDVPSMFLVSGGVGDYNVSIEIDSLAGGSSAPHVRSAMSRVLRVSQEDFDSLSGSIWNAPSNQFNTTGTMGYLQNTISSITSGTVDVPAVVSGVWSAQASNFSSAGTMGQLENSLAFISSSIQFVRDVENGTWVITGSQMVLYTSGSLIELARFNLQDVNENPINPETQNPFRRVRI